MLVTNDDGVISLGIRALIYTMNTLGKIYIVVPDKFQLGMDMLSPSTPQYTVNH
ncbi:MAG: 5'/3'-nucleotidase SurE [Flavobacteriales bacterium Tduv]